MEVILLERMGKLGNLGEKVTVKPGYGRNYLVPQGKAVPATEENLKAFEARRAELEKAQAEHLADAQSRAAKLEGVALTLVVNAGEEGKLFGSVGTREIIEALAAQQIEVDKSEVKLPEGAIRMVGEYEIDIQLHHDVTSTITLTVQPENAATNEE